MRKNKDYVGAIFLIFLGTIFLFNTTGILDWSIWSYILNFWPVFLILGGLRLILGDSLLSNIILSVLAILIFSWIGISAYISKTNTASQFLHNVFRYTSIEKEMVTKEYTVERENYEDIEEVNYDINLAISQFAITDGLDDYLNLDAQYTTEYGEPEIENVVKDNNLNIAFKEKQIRSFSFINFETPKYDFKLGSNLLTDLNIDNGIGKGTIKLENQWIRNLSVKSGTGDIDVKLGMDSIPTEKLILDIGTGNLSLNLPKDVGYIISYNVGIGEIKLGNQTVGGLGQDADEIKSENYDTAEKILNIDANVGIGQLNINFNN
jgi:uncharacterized membrane protein